MSTLFIFNIMPKYTDEEKKYITNKLDSIRSNVVKVSNSKVNTIIKKGSYLEWNVDGKGAIPEGNKNPYALGKELSIIRNENDINIYRKHLLKAIKTKNSNDIRYYSNYLKKSKEDLIKIKNLSATKENFCGSYGLNCISNVTDNYKKAKAINTIIPGNQTFQAQAKNLGFIKLNNKDSIIPADITQYLRNDIPYHAVTNIGNGLIEYAPSGDNQYKRTPEGYIANPNDPKQSYRFVGTSNDSINWKNEYNMKTEYATNKPQRFLGAAIGVASLGMGVYNMIQGSIDRKKQIEEENRINSLNEASQMKNNLLTQDYNARNFASNTTSNSWYGNGGQTGVVPEASDMSIAYGATHEQRNSIQGGTGVPYGNIEVEGGGKQGNQAGEVIKHEGQQDFIFSDRIPFDNSNSFAQVAQKLTKAKGNLENLIKLAAKEVNDKQREINFAKSIPNKNTIEREVSKKMFKVNRIKSEIEKVSNDIEALKEQQLNVGKQMGVYDENGQPISEDINNMKPKAKVGGYPDYVGKYFPQQKFTNDFSDSYLFRGKEKDFSQSIKPELDYTSSGGEYDYKKSFNMSDNDFGTALNLAQTGVNLVSNIVATNQMKKLKTPSYVPLAIKNTALVNMSADREAINSSLMSYNKYTNDNFSNPQVSSIVRQQANNQALQQLSKVNQTESQMNLGITDTNINRQLGVDTQNSQMKYQSDMTKFQKDSMDINNKQNVITSMMSDLDKTYGQRMQGINEDKIMALRERSMDSSTERQWKLVYNNIDPNTYYSSDNNGKINILKQKGFSDSDITSIFGLKLAYGGKVKKYAFGGISGVDTNVLDSRFQNIDKNMSSSVNVNTYLPNTNFNLTAPTNTKLDSLNIPKFVQNYAIQMDNDKNRVSDSLDGFQELLLKYGIKTKRTSGYRDSKTANGNISKHAIGNAMDIIPEGTTFDNMYRIIYDTPEIKTYAQKNRIGILNESDSKVLRKTKGTGKHAHVSIDENIALDFWNPQYSNKGIYTKEFYKKYNI